MPRTPEVCSLDFCPPYDTTKKVNPILTSHWPVDQVLYRRFVAGAISLLLCIAFQSSTSTAHAQGGTATLSGTVTDQNNAVVPGVNIAVISITQGFQRSATTDGEGSFCSACASAGRLYDQGRARRVHDRRSPGRGLERQRSEEDQYSAQSRFPEQPIDRRTLDPAAA